MSSLFKQDTLLFKVSDLNRFDGVEAWIKSCNHQGVKIISLWILFFSFLSPAWGISLTHDLNIHVIEDAQSNWSGRYFQRELGLAQKVLGQCGVEIQEIKKSSIKAPKEVIFDLEGYSEDTDIPDQNGALVLASQNPAVDASTVRIFLIQNFDLSVGNHKATAVPNQRVKYKDQEVARNTIWLPEGVGESQFHFPFNAGISPGYSVLAHELGHILMNTDHVNDYSIRNLMHENVGHLNGRLTQAQCQKILKSAFVHQKSKVQDLNENNANSLRCLVKQPGAVIHEALFIGKHSKNNHDHGKACAKVQKINQWLVQAQDQVSDLNPVHGKSLLLNDQGSDISYNDRGYFVSALHLKHQAMDQMVSDQQAKIIWAHELGHAILNEQLKYSLPEFQKLDEMNQVKGQKILGEIYKELGIKELGIKDIKFTSDQPNTGGLTIDEIIFLEDVMAGYHEFYADAFAILVHERQSDALLKALHADHSSHNLPDDLKDRDFSYQRDIDSWVKTDSHALLTPAQAFLWKLIREKSQQGPYLTDKEILNRLTDLVTMEIKAQWQTQTIFTPSQANRRMIDLIKVHFY